MSAAQAIPVEAPPKADPEAQRRAETRLARVGQAEQLFYALGMTPSKYLLTIALPVTLLGVGLAVMLPMLLVPLTGDPVGTALGTAGGLLLVVVALVLPFQARESRRNAIDQHMHEFITHLGVLSTTPMPRLDYFATVAGRRPYGPLADECARIEALVRRWHLALPEACRFVAARTPSHLLGDFLDRLAHALEAGDRTEDFLANEQAVVMQQYGSQYERRLYDLEGFRDLFSSLMMSAAFLSVFVLLLPVLAAVEVMSLLPMVLLVILGLLILLLSLAWVKSPRDPLWHTLPQRSGDERRARLALAPALALALVAGLAARSLGLPGLVQVAAAATPMALAAWAIRRAEDQVRRREDNYPAFVRSLGAGAASRGAAAQDAVEQLQRHDYGPLTPPLRNLHRRLALRIDTPSAWTLFASETGSHLVQTFNAMFLEAARHGGNAMKIGGIISANAAYLLALRKKRLQVAAGLRGTLLGMAGGLSFTLYLNLGIVALLTGIFSDMTMAQSVLPGIGGFREDLGLVDLFVLTVNAAYAVAAAVAIRLVQGGRMQGAFSDMALMLWIGALTSLASGAIADAIL